MGEWGEGEGLGDGGWGGGEADISTTAINFSDINTTDSVIA